MAELAIKKCINHLWYIGEETACFSLFDDRIENNVKKRMAKRLLENLELEDDEFNTEIQKKYPLKIDDVSQFLKRDLPVDLLTPKSKNMFQRFQISMEFLHQNPENWPDIDCCKKAKNVIQHLNVVNDAAKRGVKLMEDFNTKFTKNENQKQYVLKVSFKLIVY